MFDLTTTNTEQTMSSLDFLNNIINPARVAAGEREVRNRDFIKRVEDELDDLTAGETFVRFGNTVTYYNLTLEQMTLIGMRESKAVRRSVLETLKKLQRKETDEEIMMRGYMLTVKKYEQLQQTLIMKDAVIEVQEEQIHNLQNLFNEGMTPSAFVKQLNGCNANAVSSYLEQLGWIYSRERKGGKDWFAYASSRDKYLRQSSYCPNPAYPNVRIHTVQLTKQGAVKLYEMYLDSKLPMRKVWDGKFTHDVL
ncbi:putative DNA-binding protein [Escherichia phage vB_EcoP_PAS7]|uniref:DNA-binding protein n=1 Tax=Escherichia phage vB_EcoP_PAS7 TaxID=3053875 RepID=A0AA51VJA4_9CAUD|nr:putative DNA-binding protein [Escherichia phage vB_EcoP_PAS7]